MKTIKELKEEIAELRKPEVASSADLDKDNKSCMKLEAQLEQAESIVELIRGEMRRHVYFGIGEAIIKEMEKIVLKIEGWKL